MQPGSTEVSSTIPGTPGLEKEKTFSWNWLEEDCSG